MSCLANLPSRGLLVDVADHVQTTIPKYTPFLIGITSNPKEIHSDKSSIFSRIFTNQSLRESNEERKKKPTDRKAEDASKTRTADPENPPRVNVLEDEDEDDEEIWRKLASKKLAHPANAPVLLPYHQPDAKKRPAPSSDQLPSAKRIVIKGLSLVLPRSTATTQRNTNNSLSTTPFNPQAPKSSLMPPKSTVINRPSNQTSKSQSPSSSRISPLKPLSEASPTKARLAKVDYSKYLLQELRDMCDAVGIPSLGARADIIRRLESHYNEQ
eukprot:TRINITY_DN10692_c0_g1_i1.p1 TRINITY_DN10692_c0_g1~~TRINITY_DN10692_c0_g1_i1.p1  ORF type:complete len:270 (-),score=57.91 TRINITY_DN10692_c0_g1_i1:95-904(-)